MPAHTSRDAATLLFCFIVLTPSVVLFDQSSPPTAANAVHDPSVIRVPLRHDAFGVVQDFLHPVFTFKDSVSTESMRRSAVSLSSLRDCEHRPQFHRRHFAALIQVTLEN